MSCVAQVVDAMYICRFPDESLIVLNNKRATLGELRDMCRAADVSVLQYSTAIKQYVDWNEMRLLRIKYQ